MSIKGEIPESCAHYSVVGVGEGEAISINGGPLLRGPMNVSLKHGDRFTLTTASAEQACAGNYSCGDHRVLVLGPEFEASINSGPWQTGCVQISEADRVSVRVAAQPELQPFIEDDQGQLWALLISLAITIVIAWLLLDAGGAVELKQQVFEYARGLVA